jgi:alanine dehydrogenase
MIIGIPREVKEGEERVALTPSGARTLSGAGHEVIVETNAGEFCGFGDADYEAAGARVTKDQAEVWSAPELLCKVKEPLSEEFHFLREGLTVFAFLHLAACPDLIDAFQKSKASGIAYETVQLEDGTLPVLSPMSEVAGCIAVQNGAFLLEADHGGRGVLLPGISGSPPGRVTVIGGGTAGINACRVAFGMGAQVTVIDSSLKRLGYLRDVFAGRISTLLSSTGAIEESLQEADLVIGAVLIPGKRAPKLLSKSLISSMQKGSVFFDIDIDQGGIAETARPTTHHDPCFIESGVVHCCIPNIPAAVPRSATLALTARTLPYISAMASKGIELAIVEDTSLDLGVNVKNGVVVHPGVLDAMKAC